MANPKADEHIWLAEVAYTKFAEVDKTIAVIEDRCERTVRKANPEAGELAIMEFTNLKLRDEGLYYKVLCNRREYWATIASMHAQMAQLYK
jgi:hypothetical protein